MQRIIIEEPYEFVPPLASQFWPRVMQLYLPRYLRKSWGVASVECRHAERLRASLVAGHGILITPNHCRLSDPFVLGSLVRETGSTFFAMASWHLFKQDRFTRFMIRRLGAFSVYREGMDRQAINQAIEILQDAQRPLVLFPEGVVSRHNDLLMPLMDGTALIARQAARRRAKQSPPGQVVVHPTAIRYFFRGDVAAAVEPPLAEIETRLTWHSQRAVPLVDRLARVGEALLILKEVEYFGEARSGDLYERIAALIDHLLLPLEAEWRIPARERNIVERVKQLRFAMLPDMINGDLAEPERERRWRELADIYLAQQLAAYPRDYVQRGDNIPEHLLETVERFIEDVADRVQYLGPLHAVVEVGEAVPVEPERERKGGADPVMTAIEQQIKDMLTGLARESQPIVGIAAPAR